MTSKSLPTDTKRAIVTVSLPEFARRFDARGEETAFRFARPFHFGMCSGRRGSEMAFEEKPGHWVRTASEAIRLGDEAWIGLVDAKAVTALRALFIDKWLTEDPRLWRRLGDRFRLTYPYVFKQLKDGTWLPLNCDYRRFGAVAERFTGHPADFEGIWTGMTDGGDMMWLYNDEPASRIGYFGRWLKLDDHVALPGEKASR